MSNVKIGRLNNAFAREISIILQTEIQDEDIRFVTVTSCDITNDFSFCKVYVTMFDVSRKDEIMGALNGATSFIRGHLSQRVDIRHTPELKFIYDDSIDYGNRIELKLKELKELNKLENDTLN